MAVFYTIKPRLIRNIWTNIIFLEEKKTAKISKKVQQTTIKKNGR